MGNIHLLDDQVINKIAAGEVVERPASVLKELIENSIDAGATEINIELEAGGKRLIAVTDNGNGMDREDVERAVLRHATSKITAADDLFDIATMGFRGEALASIASVSKFCLRSTAKEATGGCQIEVGADGIPLVTDWDGPVGTSVIVENLFQNIPARLSFLRSDGAEYAHCSDYVQALALSLPSVAFRLKHNGRETFSAPHLSSQDEGKVRLRERIKAVLGKQAAQMVYIEKSSKYGILRGFISPPGMEKSTSKHQYFFVNGRWVKDKVLRFGVNRGYHSHLLKGRYPVVVLNFEMDLSLVDVNVHPAKTEVRFQYPSEVQSLMAMAIREGLRQGAWALPQDPVDHEGFSSAPPAFVPPPAQQREISLQGSYTPLPSSKRSFSSESRPSVVPSFEKPPSLDAMPEVEQPTIPWSDLKYIGVFAKCYLFFEWGERLLSIDQHAFHERILYERFCRDRHLTLTKQPLLMPEEVELDAEQVEALEAIRTELENLGISFRPVGDQGVEVLSVPSLLQKRDLEEVMVAFAAGDERVVPTDDLGGISHLLLATLACHSAVRAGEELGPDELKRLLAEASGVDFYHNCPHGRRVFKWHALPEVARWFDR